MKRRGPGTGGINRPAAEKVFARDAEQSFETGEIEGGGSEPLRDEIGGGGAFEPLEKRDDRSSRGGMSPESRAGIAVDKEGSIPRGMFEGDEPRVPVGRVGIFPSFGEVGEAFTDPVGGSRSCGAGFVEGAAEGGGVSEFVEEQAFQAGVDFQMRVEIDDIRGVAARTGAGEVFAPGHALQGDGGELFGGGEADEFGGEEDHDASIAIEVGNRTETGFDEGEDFGVGEADDFVGELREMGEITVAAINVESGADSGGDEFGFDVRERGFAEGRGKARETEGPARGER